jgi:hypothetical protein
MSARITLPETGVVRVGGVPLTAVNIHEHAPFTRPDGPVAPTAQIHVGEEDTLEVQAGDEIEIAGQAYRVAAVTEDPVHQRGEVVLEPLG